MSELITKNGYYEGFLVLFEHEKSFIRLIKSVNFVDGSGYSPNERVFAISLYLNIGSEPKNVIFVNNEEWSKINDDARLAIMTHELAHCNGIKGEESADLWAMKRLPKESRKFLLKYWKSRHGHNYDNPWYVFKRFVKNIFLTEEERYCIL